MTARPAYRNHRFLGENSPKISASRTTVPEKTSVRQHIEHLRRGYLRVCGVLFRGWAEYTGPETVETTSSCRRSEPHKPRNTVRLLSRTRPGH